VLARGVVNRCCGVPVAADGRKRERISDYERYSMYPLLIEKLTRQPIHATPFPRLARIGIALDRADQTAGDAFDQARVSEPASVIDHEHCAWPDEIRVRHGIARGYTRRAILTHSIPMCEAAGRLEHRICTTFRPRCLIEAVVDECAAPGTAQRRARPL